MKKRKAKMVRNPGKKKEKALKRFFGPPKRKTTMRPHNHDLVRPEAEPKKKREAVEIIDRGSDFWPPVREKRGTRKRKMARWRV